MMCDFLRIIFAAFLCLDSNDSFPLLTACRLRQRTLCSQMRLPVTGD